MILLLLEEFWFQEGGEGCYFLVSKEYQYKKHFFLSDLNFIVVKKICISSSISRFL